MAGCRGGPVIGLLLESLYVLIMGQVGSHMLLYLIMPAVSSSCEIFLGYLASSVLNIESYTLFDIDFFFIAQFKWFL